jgi:hypothetical protein
LRDAGLANVGVFGIKASFLEGSVLVPRTLAPNLPSEGLAPYLEPPSPFFARLVAANEGRPPGVVVAPEF